jgi:hypothetical protein
LSRKEELQKEMQDLVDKLKEKQWEWDRLNQEIVYPMPMQTTCSVTLGIEDLDHFQESMNTLYDLKEYGRPFLLNHNNLYLCYNADKGELIVNNATNLKQNTVYFANLTAVETAIAKIGEKRIIEWLKGDY